MMEEWDADEILKELEFMENIRAIQEIEKKEEKRRETNARYYEKNKEKIAYENSKTIRCTLCDKKLQKGSLQLHKKSKLHTSLLNTRLDSLEDD
jgi:hypothetical protein